MQNFGGDKKLIMVFSKVANGNLYTSVLSPMHTILAQETQLWALTVSHDRSNFVDISVRGHEVPAKFQNRSGCSIVCTCKPNKCKTSFLIYFDLHPQKALKPHMVFLLTNFCDSFWLAEVIKHRENDHQQNYINQFHYVKSTVSQPVKKKLGNK